MLTIQLLGVGCTKCKTMEVHLTKAIKTLDIHASIEYIEDIEVLLNYNITGTPALIINGEVKVNNEVLSYEKLIELLQTDFIE